MGETQESEAHPSVLVVVVIDPILAEHAATIGALNVDAVNV